MLPKFRYVTTFWDLMDFSFRPRPTPLCYQRPTPLFFLTDGARESRAYSMETEKPNLADFSLEPCFSSSS